MRTVLSSKAFLTVLVLFIVAVVGFGYYRSQSSALQAEVSSYKSQVSSLESQLSSAKFQSSSLQSEITSYKSQIASLTSQISTLQGQVSSGNSQISSLQSQVSSLQSQNKDLQNIASLSLSSTKVNTVTLNQGAGEITSVSTFTADYAGYVIVTGTSTSALGYILVNDSYSGYPYNNYSYPFGTGSTVLVPVLPGLVKVYFGNNNYYNGATATLTITYYY